MNTVRAYHFVADNYALDNLRHRRLKIARIDELNDPFELWSIAQSDPQVRRALQNTKNNLAGRFGMLCLSLSWHNPLLWSHYANRHRGVALGFDISEEKLKKVCYVEKRPVLKRVNIEAVNTMLFTKYVDWKYENEVRIFTALNNPDPGSHLYFAPFSEDLVLREVIVGPLSCVTTRSLREALQTKEDVTLIKSRLAFNSFQIVKDKRGFRAIG
jgi:hypothetical protein